MMSEAFSNDLQQFIDANVESLAQLEALLLLRSEPQREWTADALAKALYITREMGAALLQNLVSRGLARPVNGKPDRFVYSPASADSRNLVERLARVYEERRVAVITQIYSKPVNKVQTFADAFRIRREE
jgi:DNA-binding MarR family transcriptional regulator